MPTNRTTLSSNILDVARKKAKEIDFDYVAFAIWLRNTREKFIPNMTQSALADAVGVVRQRISELEGGDRSLLPKPPSRPGLDLVEKIAIVLNVDINQARQMAGYNSFPVKDKRPFNKPKNVRDFFEILNYLDLDVRFEGGMEKLEHLGEDQLQELLDSAVANASAKVKRLYEKM